jgi:hypothetical protein
MSGCNTLFENLEGTDLLGDLALDITAILK